MKRMLFICAALLTASIASAVESANIVGYQQQEGTGNYAMIGSVFTPVLDPTGAKSFTESFIGNFAAGDEVQFLQEDGTYKVLTYYVGDLADPDFTQFDLTGWGDGGIQEDYDLSAGVGFWINTSAVFDQFGQVQIAENNQVLTTSANYTMISAPYPLPYNVSDLTFVGIQAGDEMQFLQLDGTYKVLTYYVGDLADPDFTQFDLTGWGDGGVQEDYVLASGESCWIRTAAEVTVSFLAPSTL